MILYNISLYLIKFIYPISVLLGGKLKRGYKGRKGLIRKAKELFEGKNEKIIWFHCASLGEFEQGREVIEGARERFPDYKILLTFFSPSGFEQKKNYSGADYIMYLPLDTPSAARRFVRAINPKIVVFVKYEFWRNIISQCKKVGAEVYVVSAIFRKEQYFFKWYGMFGRRTLSMFNHIFVQDKNSLYLLNDYGLHNASVAGDTRFDRVSRLSKQAKPIEIVEQFLSDNPTHVFVAGSTWEPDDKIILESMVNFPDMKFIIVPHELSLAKIVRLRSAINDLGRKCCTFLEGDTTGADVLIIDTMGVLSSVYRYATVAYIGGGFGVGIHNTLEAATYGLPIAFGTNYKRFAEACDLISFGAATSISNSEELTTWISSMNTNLILRRKYSDISRRYVEKKCGATEKILDYLVSPEKGR